ncbi:MAG: DUF3943 domain-containing protein [Odoribacter sp.]|nr:DUF3943 domain-containing protein [Odoribacter sp.]
MKKTLIILLLLLPATVFRMGAQVAGNDSIATDSAQRFAPAHIGVTFDNTYETILTPRLPEPFVPVAISDSLLPERRHSWISPYTLPYTRHAVNPNWHRMWINTAVLSGAFVGTLFVLELLPEDATSWNRASIQQTPMFKRWFRNIFKRGPEWDHDNPIFNYVLHPYAGAAYFMAARSCGFSFWGSLLYSAAISTVGWEFGIEAFMERPSYQDIFVTPIVGSVLGELCYRGKHAIINRGYELLGSPVLGHVACFFLDPVNEVVDLFRGNPASPYAKRRRIESSFAPSPSGFALIVKF